MLVYVDASMPPILIGLTDQYRHVVEKVVQVSRLASPGHLPDRLEYRPPAKGTRMKTCFLAREMEHLSRTSSAPTHHNMRDTREIRYCCE